MRQLILALVCSAAWGQVSSVPSGSFTVASQAEAEAGANNTNGMTALRVSQSIQALVQAGDGIQCVAAGAALVCSTSSAVMQVTSGTAVPGSCTSTKQIFVDTDAASTEKLHYCNGTAYERAGGQVVYSGTKALDTDAIASTACDTMTQAATGTASTDVVSWTFNADVTAVTGYAPATAGGLSIYIWPSTNTINIKVCNPTASSITPGAVSLNLRVVR